jgi:hypothetical protein
MLMVCRHEIKRVTNIVEEIVHMNDYGERYGRETADERAQREAKWRLP